MQLAMMIGLNTNTQYTVATCLFTMNSSTVECTQWQQILELNSAAERHYFILHSTQVHLIEDAHFYNCLQIVKSYTEVLSLIMGRWHLARCCSDWRWGMTMTMNKWMIGTWGHRFHCISFGCVIWITNEWIVSNKCSSWKSMSLVYCFHTIG